MKDYYYGNGLSAMDVIEKWCADVNGIEAFWLGNAIKYICRYRYKGTAKDDLEKAIIYLDYLKDNIPYDD